VEYRYIDPAANKETDFFTRKLNFVAGKYYVVVGITEKMQPMFLLMLLELFKNLSF
jgi:hypothetical protein